MKYYKWRRFKMLNVVDVQDSGIELAGKYLNELGFFSINASNAKSVKENIQDIKNYALPENASPKRVRTLELGKTGDEIFDGMVMAHYENHTIFGDLSNGEATWFQTKDYDCKFDDRQIYMKHRSGWTQLYSNRLKKYKVEDNKVYRYAWELKFVNSYSRYKLEDNKVLTKNVLGEWFICGNEARYKEENEKIYVNYSDGDWELVYADDNYFVKEENGKIWGVRKDALDWNLVYDNGIWVETLVKILNDGYGSCGKTGLRYTLINLGNEKILSIRLHQLITLFSLGVRTFDCIGESYETTLEINHLIDENNNGFEFLEITTSEGNKAYARYKDKLN
jgi:hypothetical protein